MSTAFERRVTRLRAHVLSHEKGSTGQAGNQEPPKEPPMPELPPELEDWKVELQGMTVGELKELAEVLGIEIPSKTVKSEIVGLLVASKLEVDVKDENDINDKE